MTLSWKPGGHIVLTLAKFLHPSLPNEVALVITNVVALVIHAGRIAVFSH
jgi:hypothetical protein